MKRFSIFIWLFFITFNLNAAILPKTKNISFNQEKKIEEVTRLYSKNSA